MSDERPDGFYWVKVNEGDKWEAAQYFRGGWLIVGNECDFYDPSPSGSRTLHEIGPYIGTEPQDTGWRDIASAPKDGTPVLLFLPPPFLKLAMARWHEPWGTWITVDYPDNPEDGEYFGIGVNVPTHWMPVPAAPKMKEKGE
jgi:hypothetical protein